MKNSSSFSVETIDNSLVVLFTQSSLVFPDQLKAIEKDFESSGVKLFVFDFSGVEHISSSIWGQIIIWNKKFRESNRKLRLCHLSENLREVLDAMKLDQILDVCETREDAVSLPGN